MANRKNNVEIIPAFTNDEKKLYKKLTDVITATQSKADGLARTISGALWEIKEKKLYMVLVEERLQTQLILSLGSEIQTRSRLTVNTQTSLGVL